MYSLPSFFFIHDAAPTEISTLSLHDALPISTTAHWKACGTVACRSSACSTTPKPRPAHTTAAICSRRSEEHTSELQSLRHLVCRLLLEKKNSHYIHRLAYKHSFSSSLTAPLR